MAKSITKKNYIRGGAKLKTFDNGGEIIHVSMNKADLDALPVSDTGYVRISLSRKDAVDDYGNAYSVYEDTFVPDKSKAAARPPQAPKAAAPKGYGAKSGLPF